MRYFSTLFILFVSIATYAQPNGDTFPDFTYTDLNGNVHNLQSYLDDGKTVVIDVFATWCPHCVNSVPGWEELYELHGQAGDQSMVLLSFERDPNTSNELQYVANNNIESPVITEAANVINQLWNISYQPRYFVVCPDGSFKADFNSPIYSNPQPLIDQADECEAAVTCTDVTTQQSVTICAGENFNGYTQSGNYQISYPIGENCDSLVILNLEVLPAQNTEINTTLCENETNQTSGVYTTNIVGANGCNAISTTYLTVLPIENETVEMTLCENETNQTSGVYTNTEVGANGCDLITTTILTVLPVQNTQVEMTLCENQTNQTSGVYTTTEVGANGCDAITTTILTVVPVINTEVEMTLCENETNQTSGVYTSSEIAADGCETITTTYLTVVPVINTEVEMTLCENETNQSSGVYTSSEISAEGCETITTTYLTVVPVTNTEVEMTLCESETNQTSGVFTETLVSSAGCDSLVTTVLTVNPTYNSSMDVSICPGEDFLGYENEGTYDLQFSSQLGCDSLVTLNLQVAEATSTECMGMTSYSGSLNNASNIWPNPCHNQLNIQIPTGSEHVRFSILDTKGQEFFPTFLNNNDGLINVEVHDLNPGLYFLQMKSSTGNINQVQTFVKLKY